MTALDARLVQLAADLRREWGIVEANLARARSVDPTASAPEAAFVALALDHLYQAFETLLLRLERALALPERAGGGWHAALLADAGLPLPGLRAAVFPLEAERHWQALLRFRHFLRHAYAVELDPRELAANVRHAEAAVAATVPAFEALIAALGASA